MTGLDEHRLWKPDLTYCWFVTLKHDIIMPATIRDISVDIHAQSGMLNVYDTNCADLLTSASLTRLLIQVCADGWPAACVFCGRNVWIQYLYSKSFIETIYSEDLRRSGWLLSFLWACQWIRCLLLECVGSWELSLCDLSPQAPALCGGTSFLRIPCRPPLRTSFLFPFFFLLQAQVKLILFHNFLSVRFLP